MALLVTLDVFSGKPNRSWVLTSKQEQDFCTRLERAGPDSAASHREGKLGYRGFTVRDTEVGGEGGGGDVFGPGGR